MEVSNRLNPVWPLETKSWGNEPLRRIYHTACESGGKVYLIGGEKTDGSGNAFSDHYVFDPSASSFTQLPTTNGPPDLFGHASVILADRRLLVFGGYSPSENSLMAFSTVWTLDTSSSNYTWTATNVANTTLPSPRRGFAAAILDDGKVLIQGGADADMQNVYSDGWVLDTTQSPMSWTAVDALTQVGPRRDHFAVAVGSEVIFGFGYGASAPANASLLLFDASQGAFVSSYTPPPAVTSPSTTTLPAASGTSLPSGTAGGSTGTQGSSSTSSGQSGSGGKGGSNGNGNGNGNGSGGGGGNDTGKSSKSHSAAVAAGIVAGVLGLVAGGAAALYLSRRRPSNSSFHRLGASDDDDDSPHMGPVIPVVGHAGSREKPLGVQNVKQKLAGLVPGRAARQQTARRDMLADEDTMVFEPTWLDVRRDGSIGSWSSGGRRVRPSLGDMVQGSLTSLKNVGGAMLAYASGTRRTRDTSGDSNATYWEKEPSYGYSDKGHSDKIAFVPLAPGAASRPKGGRQASDVSQWTYYEDPFADYEVESFKMPDEDYDDDAVEIHGAPFLNDPPPKPYLYSRVAKATDDVSRLTPVSEKPYFATVTDHIIPSSSSDSSHGALLTPPASADNSRSSHEALTSPRRPSSIIDANPPLASTMRRSDSWWSRFTKTPLLDRAFSADASRSRSLHPLEFRDPNPPPRLNPIKESSNSSSPQDESSKRDRRDDPMYASIHHGRSATSLQTSKTADSAEIEKMGRTMDIVYKGIHSSHGSHNSRGSTSTTSSYEPAADPHEPKPLSVIIPTDTDDLDRSSPPGLGFVMSPTAMTTTDVQQPTPARRSSGNVAARIAAFEEHGRSPPAPPQGRSKQTQSVYGLAPKPSLFVANPDRRTGSGDS
ncbi:hypothetical protein DICSQDRAFT_124948 [Dichomitus squalens LYAD-421 SS1]|uniref:uncharacterized protein n=1 Tax=Dichomitus squalens (strain LYAD-421) TaxID=732165 RepID=UPI0004411267|nr:uncharacterized protein DICSQDRAFT_124948 [Dichomitus squalens LYAD-421 SS1]EJF64787.1 hypothetical protein DICSQDRAFT_124948 [Dichomitus squalens LYAD-421 SS1]